MPLITQQIIDIRNSVRRQINVRWRLNFTELMAAPYNNTDTDTLMDLTVDEINAFPPFTNLSIIDFAIGTPLHFLLVVGTARNAIGGIIADLTHSQVNLSIDGVELESQLPVYQELFQTLEQQYENSINDVKVRLNHAIRRGTTRSQYTSTGRGRGQHTLAQSVRNVRYR